MKIGIQAKLIAIFSILIMVPIIVLGFLSYSKTEQTLISEIREDNMNTIESMNKYFIENFLESVENSVNVWAADAGNDHNYSDIVGIRRMMRQWEGYIKTNEYIQWIYLGTQDGRYYLVPWDSTMPKDYDPRKRIWYKAALEAKGKTVWTEPYKDAGSGGMMVTATKVVIDGDHPDRVVGAFGVDLQLIKLSLLLQTMKFGEGGYVFLMDDEGYIVAHSLKKSIGTFYGDKPWVKQILKNKRGSFPYSFDGKDYYVSYSTVRNTGWKLVGIVPQKTLIKQADPIKRRTVLVAAISMLAAVFIAVLFSRSIGKKIERMVQYMEEVENGNLTIRSYYRGNDEFKELNHRFNRMVYNLSKNMEEIKLLSVTDGLTKLYNHKFVTETLEKSIYHAVENHEELSLMMIDIDNFKRINDQYGHQKGDEVLIALAEVMTNNLRNDDTIGRYGGEEFLIIMPGVNIEEACLIAERLRKKTEEIAIKDVNDKITISIGVSQYGGETSNEFVNKVDILLYKAKRNGKNRVERELNS